MTTADEDARVLARYGITPRATVGEGTHQDVNKILPGETEIQARTRVAAARALIRQRVANACRAPSNKD